MTVIDRLAGVNEGVAVKAPCQAATTANIALTALQTIDGVALTAGDRVLVKDQTNGVDNGIWVASSGAWSRARDFNGTRDVVQGTAVFVLGGTISGNTFYKLSTASPDVGTDSLTFTPFLDSSSLAFTQAGTGAVTRTVNSRLRDSVNVFDFMTELQIADVKARTLLLDVTSAVQAALTAVQTAGGGSLYLPAGYYKITSALSYTSAPLAIFGDGQDHSVLVDMGVAAAQYVLNINQTDYEDPTYLAAFSIHTTQDVLSYGLYISYGQNDAIYNRAALRCIVKDMNIRSHTVNGVGWPDKGFVRGITIQNIIRPTLSGLNISGKQTGHEYNQVNSMVTGIYLISTLYGAPTDPLLFDVQVYFAQIALLAEGPWQGIKVDGCIFVECQYGLRATTTTTGAITATSGNGSVATITVATGVPGYAVGASVTISGVTPAGYNGTYTVTAVPTATTFTFASATTGSMTVAGTVSIPVSLPWLSVQNSHINTYETAIQTTGFFDVQIQNNLIYKWDFGTLTLNVASSAVFLTDGHRAIITGNVFNNLTYGLSNKEYYAVQLADTWGAVISDNAFSGVTYGVTLSGTSYSNTYRRGSWTVLPGFGATPVEYRVTGSGANNVRYNCIDSVSDETVGANAITALATMLTVTLPTAVEVGDEIEVIASVIGTKDVTAAPCGVFVVLDGTATATINWYHDRGYLQQSQYALNGLSMSVNLYGRLNVTGRGTLVLNLQANSTAGTWDIAAGNAQIKVWRR